MHIKTCWVSFEIEEEFTAAEVSLPWMYWVASRNSCSFLHRGANETSSEKSYSNIQAPLFIHMPKLERVGISGTTSAIIDILIDGSTSTDAAIRSAPSMVFFCTENSTDVTCLEWYKGGGCDTNFA